MAKYRDSEFVDFCNTGLGCVSGALTMKGDHVHSYDMNIAIVDRVKKSIRFFGQTRSRTTTRHQNSILRAFEITLKSAGWTIEKSF